jgi:hypothetical protein
MLNSLILMPAYGRVYLTEDAAMADWKAGKDFRIVNGPYCSVRDLAKMQTQLTTVYLHLPNLKKSVILSSHFN